MLKCDQHSIQSMRLCVLDQETTTPSGHLKWILLLIALPIGEIQTHLVKRSEWCAARKTLIADVHGKAQRGGSGPTRQKALCGFIQRTFGRQVISVARRENIGNVGFSTRLMCSIVVVVILRTTCEVPIHSPTNFENAQIIIIMCFKKDNDRSMDFILLDKHSPMQPLDFREQNQQRAIRAVCILCGEILELEPKSCTPRIQVKLSL